MRATRATPPATGRGWWATAPSPSPETHLAPADAAALLDIADAAIVEGLLGRPACPPKVADLPSTLREVRGVFVTLMVDDALNGCIGNVEGVEPMGQAVARHALASAFADPRLPPLVPADYPGLSIEISVLSTLSPLPADTRDELTAALRPGEDGLLITGRHHQAVFLPAVWEQLPDAAAFLDHLLAKAGLAPGGWPHGVRAFRFTATKYSRPAGRQGPSRAA
jgi:AmmeMemoRadiSam system protein A